MEMKLKQQRKGCVCMHVCGRDTTKRNGLMSTGQTEAREDRFSHSVVAWKQTAREAEHLSSGWLDGLP